MQEEAMKKMRLETTSPFQGLAELVANDEGLFVNVFSNTVVFKVNNPDLSVLTPKFDK